MFECKCCRERFPTFHPAYSPPSELGLELLKPGKNGVAACNVAVKSWESFPPPPEAPAEELLVATSHTGLCLGCHVDIEGQRVRMARDPEGGEALVGPKRSFLNYMDPLYRCPWDDLRFLFEQATTLESMLVSLEHMQVLSLIHI